MPGLWGRSPVCFSHLCFSSSWSPSLPTPLSLKKKKCLQEKENERGRTEWPGLQLGFNLIPQHLQSTNCTESTPLHEARRQLSGSLWAFLHGWLFPFWAYQEYWLIPSIFFLVCVFTLISKWYLFLCMKNSLKFFLRLFIELQIFDIMIYDSTFTTHYILIYS